MKCSASCSCCQTHERTIQALQEQMLNEVNSYRKLLQMPPLTSIDSSFLTLSKTPVSTTVCPSVNIVPSIPLMSSRRTLEAMPREILDRIVSFVSGRDILQLCHAVRYFKYISKAMFDFGYPLRMRTPHRLVRFNFWPCVHLRQTIPVPYEATLPVPISHLQVLQNYSTILSKHGGCASIDDSTGITVLGALPENVAVLVNHAKLMDGMDEFFGALYNAKKNIRELSLGVDYFDRCNSNPASLDMTSKWLVKLPIRDLRFLSYTSIPTQILSVLHLAPILNSLYVPNLEDCAAVSLCDCKSLRRLSIFKTFEGEESAEEVVRKVLDVVKPTNIHEVAMHLPFSWQTFVGRDDLRVLLAALFLRHGWLEYPERLERPFSSVYFICRSTSPLTSQIRQ
ncbi:hypothetical protein BJ741DRAFT_629225 [Chytriomyces cf. hyalinus JEL632]|nr:hypothetical protein BJ741DRAFT_629225 [Chytriomyces cf. hyalinus JEL632]